MADSFLTRFFQDVENFGSRLVRDGGLSLKVVGLDSIPGGDAVLVEQQAEARLVGKVEDLLRFAFDDQSTELVAANWKLQINRVKIIQDSLFHS